MAETATLTGRIRPRAALWGRRLVLQVEVRWWSPWEGLWVKGWRDAQIEDLTDPIVVERIYGEGDRGSTS